MKISRQNKKNNHTIYDVLIRKRNKNKNKKKK